MHSLYLVSSWGTLVYLRSVELRLELRSVCAELAAVPVPVPVPEPVPDTARACATVFVFDTLIQWFQYHPSRFED
jgi:hypothetical protein